jgi:hypothetical protein
MSYVCIVSSELRASHTNNSVFHSNGKTKSNFTFDFIIVDINVWKSLKFNKFLLETDKMYMDGNVDDFNRIE